MSCLPRLFSELSSAWDGCQTYYFRSWARRSALQTALQTAAKVRLHAAHITVSITPYISLHSRPTITLTIMLAVTLAPLQH